MQPQGGFCRAALLPAVAEDLWRHRARKGGLVQLEHRERALQRAVQQKLIAGGLSAEEAAALWPEEHEEWQQQRDWMGELCEGLQFEGACRWRMPREHVNCSELRALRVAVRRIIAEGGFGKRVLIGSDSAVAMGATAKGRTSSPTLGAIQQHLTAELLFNNIQLGVLPVRTQFNPADDPSRGLPVRQAVLRPGEWVERYLGGELQALEPRLPPDSRERWLFEDGAAPGAAAEYGWGLSAAEFSARDSGLGRAPRGARDSGLGRKSSANEDGDGPSRSARDSGLGRKSSANEDGDGPPRGARDSGLGRKSRANEDGDGPAGVSARGRQARQARRASCAHV